MTTRSQAAVRPEGVLDVEGFTDDTQIFQQCFAHCNDAIMISDTEGKVLFINSAFTKLYGYEGREVIGKPVSLIRHGSSQPEIFAYHHTKINPKPPGGEK